jgi:predicted DNA-binding helix-hairpin-helix protein
MSLAERKLTVLTAAGKYDLCSPGECIQRLSSAPCVTYKPRSGGCGRMLKVLLHGTCSHDCAYCAVRLQRDRMGYAPDELAETFLRLWQEGRVGGLFLSSGIAGDVDEVMHDLVATGELLRQRGYDGYLHLKILPGANRSDIRDAARAADRISINLETPSADRLDSIAGVKDYRQDILKRQAWVAEAKPDRHTTQLVVGAADETDTEILSCVIDQYRRVRPARIYYSAFRALPDTPLAAHPDTPAWRAHRWYQIDYLLRVYRIRIEELKNIIGDDGFLSDRDPKEALATGMARVNINTASRHDLLSVPGIGPKGADRILHLRRNRPFAGLSDLKRAGIRERNAGPYITFGAHEAVQARLEV